MRRTTIPALAAAAALTLGAAPRAEPAESAGASPRGFLFRALEHEGRTYEYAVYVPRELPEGPPPVILFLHGRGESGTDGSRQLAVGLGEALLWNPERWPFVVVLPQKPDQSSQWPEHGAAAMAMLDRTIAEFDADPDRVYLTGLSQGGHGTWLIGARHAERFAAVAPVCGYVRVPFRDGQGKPIEGEPDDPRYAEIAKALANTSVWIFHGGADPVVPASESTIMHRALQAAGNEDVRMNIYDGVGHDAWRPAYADPALPEWFLAHRRR